VFLQIQRTCGRETLPLCHSSSLTVHVFSHQSSPDLGALFVFTHLDTPKDGTGAPAFIVKGAFAFSDAPTLVHASATCSAWRQHAENKALWTFLLSLRPAPALVSQNATLPRQEFLKTVQEERRCLEYLKVCAYSSINTNDC
jgi:hypothetical protein